ncbi:MAG: LCP family protein [Leptolyngbyaceae cyanobacterium MO_188.B28]|nr:LCP family protein [Leptolyngbyaceae cyanobacterium MO_188.B28]
MTTKSFSAHSPDLGTHRQIGGHAPQTGSDNSAAAPQPDEANLEDGAPTTRSANGVGLPLPLRPSFWVSLVKTVMWGLIFVSTAAVSATLGAAFILVAPLDNLAEPIARVLPPGKSVEPLEQPSLSLKDLWDAGFRYQVTSPVNILVMGIDEVPNVPDDSPKIFSGRTDTMLLVRIDPIQGTANVLSIPRDTRVDIPGERIAKINHANTVGGAKLAARTVSYNLGGVPIDRYVRVSTVAFREMVDLVKGVEVLVPKPMYYRDRAQDLTIDLEAGWQTLNGEEAEQFARYRQDAYGDIGRVQRQQMLLKALRDRLTSPAIIPQLPQAIRILQRYIDTNLSLEEMLALANFALELQPEDMHMVMLPGRFSDPEEFVASYWIQDREASSRIVNEFFNTDTVALLSNSRQRSISRLKIAVQDASGDPNTVTDVVQYLQDQGFYNVYSVRSWPDTTHQTQVIAQRGDLDSADILKSVLGLGQVVADSTGDLDSDLTIRVGQDWLDKLVYVVR